MRLGDPHVQVSVLLGAASPPEQGHPARQRALLPLGVQRYRPQGRGPPVSGQALPLPHLLQAAALPGGDLGVGPERLAELLNAALRHRDLPLGHQDVLRGTGGQEGGTAGTVVPLPALLPPCCSTGQ